jgi:WAS/WASL-interacting protein
MSNPAPPAALPPLGPAIEVATPPTPPLAPAPPIAALAPPAAEPPPQRSLELSDLWHPYRAVKKGLNWAGDQLPIIGGDVAEPSSPTPSRREAPAVIPAAASAHAAPAARPAAPSAPIPLWPDTKPEAADKPPPGKPGPGSGGLY